MRTVYIWGDTERYGNYRRAVETAGGAVRFGGETEGCDALLLPGGGDFFPEWYGQTLLPGLKTDTFSMDWERQKTTLELVRMMAASGVE